MPLYGVKGSAIGMIAILLNFMPALVWADVTFYDVSLPVETQGDEERQGLIKKGFEKILQRMTGETDFSRQPELQQAIKNAADYVDQYTYEGNMLVIKFSAEQINRLTNKYGMKSRQRQAKVVLWLALEDQQQRRLIGSETDPKLQSFLAQVSQEKGIPFILPLMDLEDVSGISVTDVWGQFPTVLQQASQRYGTQVILVGRLLHLAHDNWSGQWQLLNDKSSPSWEVTGKSLEDVVAQGVAATAAHLKGQVSEENNQYGKSKPILIGIENIQSSKDFSKVEAYLRGMDNVLEVNVSQIVGNGVIFEVTLKGSHGRYAFEKLLSADQHFVMSPNHMPSAQVDMMYRWLPPATHSSTNRWEEWENTFDKDNEGMESPE